MKKYIFLLLLISSTSFAQNFNVSVRGPVNGDKSLNIFVSGTFEKDSSEHFARVLQGYKIENLQQANVHLNSHGGHLISGLEVGKIIRRYNMKTYVSGKTHDNRATIAECYSACAYAFLGGTTRYVPQGSKLGVHQFIDTKSNLTAIQSSSLAQMMSGAIVSYIIEMGVDPQLYSVITSVPPNKMYVLNTNELRTLKVAEEVNQIPVVTKIHQTQSPTVSPQWTTVGLDPKTKETIVAVDYSRSFNTDGLLNIWWKDYSNKELKSVKYPNHSPLHIYRSQINCNSRSIKNDYFQIILVRNFDDPNPIWNSPFTYVPEWFVPDPGSATEFLITSVCKK